MRAILLAVLVLVGGCGSSVSPFDRPPGETMAPPAWYGTLYVEVAGCAGSDMPFADIHWYVVPGGSWTSTVDHETSVTGEWWPPNDIYIAAYWLDHRRVVAHEMLHYAIQDHRHPSPPFGVCDQENTST